MKCENKASTVIENISIEVTRSFIDCAYSDYLLGCEAFYIVTPHNTLIDTLHGIELQTNFSSTTMNHTNGKAHCEALEQAGHSDWRLPTSTELLMSIVNIAPNGAGITNLFKSELFTSIATGQYVWSDSFYRTYTTRPLTHQPSRLLQILSETTLLYYVMCVRDYDTDNDFLKTQKYVYNSGLGQKRNVSDFILNGCGSGTILDNLTKRCWQQSLSGVEMEWLTAKNYCENLELGNHSDWELPDLKELATLLGYSSETIQTIVTSYGFSNIPNGYLYSNKEYYGGTNNVYYACFRNARPYYFAKTETTWRHAFCVRRDF